MKHFKKAVSFLSSDDILRGNIFLPKTLEKSPGLLILHGAGESTKERYIGLQEYLCDQGFASLAFDFRGVGESSGKFSEGSLNNRLKDAEAALIELQKHIGESPIAIAGFSMGGHIATQLIEKNSQIKALILCSAAAYSKEAEEKLLNEEFTKAIKIKNSWQNSPAFRAIEQSHIPTLIIYGKNDTVIPEDVKQQYKNASGKRGEYVILPGLGHNILLTQKSGDVISNFLRRYLS